MDATAGATIALAVVAFVSIAVSLRLAHLTRKAVEAATRAAKASEVQATVALRQASEAADFRAAMAVARLEPGTTHGFPADPSALTSIEVVNHGPGVAYRVLAAAMPSSGVTFIGTTTSIGAQERADLTCTRMPRELLNVLGTGHGNWVLFYEDALGNRHRQRPGHEPEVVSPVEDPEWVSIWAHAGFPPIAKLPTSREG